MKKEDQKQICADCGETMKRSEMAFTVDYSSDVGVIRKVPTLVCTLCGMEWIEGNAGKESK